MAQSGRTLPEEGPWRRNNPLVEMGRVCPARQKMSMPVFLGMWEECPGPPWRPGSVTANGSLSARGLSSYLVCHKPGKGMPVWWVKLFGKKEDNHHAVQDICWTYLGAFLAGCQEWRPWRPRYRSGHLAPFSS